jgi:hypothetical protein
MPIGSSQHLYFTQTGEWLNLDNNDVHLDDAFVEIKEDLAADLRSHDNALKDLERVHLLGVIISSHPVLDGELGPNGLDM